ncbi:MAG: MFS transporter [Candidatus Kariarchaeaceae archaeon]
MGISKEILFISATVSFVMTGFGIIFPIMPFYLEEFSGTDFHLGVMASAFAITSLIFSPVAGTVADRIGKKYVIAFGLLCFGFINYLFVFATGITYIIALRALEGIFVAGIAPSAISLVSDIAKEEERARNIAFVTAGMSFGIIVGPLLGGVFYDTFDSVFAPFIVSGTLGFIAFPFALKVLPNPHIPKPNIVHDEKLNPLFTRVKDKFNKTPKPKHVFGFLLIITFANTASWMLIEPSFLFYFYTLDYIEPEYEASQFGLFVAAYGVFVFIGEVVFGGLSDRYGRRPLIFIGGIIHMGFYIYLVFVDSFLNLIIAASIAGIGLGLVGPALNAMISEASNPAHRTFVLGLTTSAASLAQIIGPIFGPYLRNNGLSMSGLFLMSASAIGIGVILSLFLIFEDPSADQLTEKIIVKPVIYSEDVVTSLSE